MNRPKLFLLDAFALIYRAHFTFIKSPRITTTQINTSAVYGFANTILEVLQKEKPSHLGVAFESKSPTFRHLEFEAYKAQRPDVPEDIITAIPYIFRFLEAMGIPVLVAEGFEADDVIGTLAVKGANNGFDVFMMTPDKDYAQIVNDHIFMYRPSSKGNGIDVIDREGVIQRYGVPPENITDLLGLQGDASDNIPGVPKVGEKTALELIKQFGSLENVLDNIDKITKKAIAQSLTDFAEQGRLSKRLATIATDVPINFDAEALEISAPNPDLIIPLFNELEFKSILKRVLGDDLSQAAPTKANSKSSQAGLFEIETIPIENDNETEPPLTATNYQDIESIAHNYILCNTPELRASLITQLEQQSIFCFDTETTSLDVLTAEIVGLSICFEAHTAYFITFPADKEKAKHILYEFKAVFENETIAKVAQNIKYDYQILNQYGVEIKGQLFDTMLAHYVLHSDMRHNMDIIAQGYLNYSPISFDELTNKTKGKKAVGIREVEIERLVDYACEDADITWQLYEQLAPKIIEQSLDKLLFEVEIPLAPVLAQMEMSGVKIDVPFLNDYSKEIGKEIELHENQIYQLAGEKFNINSPKQMGDILFEKLKLGSDGKSKKTKTGQNSTSEQVLQDLAAKGYELPSKILEYRHLAKLKSTYIDALPAMVHPQTNRVHTNFNQAVAITGRLSSTGPNLQNIPIRTDMGKEIRKAFIATDSNHILIAADYSQIELRIMAALSQDPAMLDAFQNNKDIHTATASKVFKVDLADVDSDMRRKAKMVNFGLIYGVTAFGLSQRLGVSRTEAKSIMDAYFSEYAKVHEFMSQSIEKAKKTGYATTLMGRKHLLRDINSSNPTVRGFAERNAINTPIQGTAADMIKLAMIRIQKALKQNALNTIMTMQVHDELIFDVPNNELEVVKPLIQNAMIHALELGVPIEVNIGVGQNWLEAH